MNSKTVFFFFKIDELNENFLSTKIKCEKSQDYSNDYSFFHINNHFFWVMFNAMTKCLQKNFLFTNYQKKVYISVLFFLNTYSVNRNICNTSHFEQLKQHELNFRFTFFFFLFRIIVFSTQKRNY